MKYQILKQYIPGNDKIWVGSLGTNDPLHIFSTLQQAETKMNQLKSADPTRGFKIVEYQA